MQALTALTLTAGFASTVFAPLTSALAAHLTWRQTYLVLAVVLALITIPAHALALRVPWPSRAGPAADLPVRDRQVLASRAFIQLAVAATLCSLVQYAGLVNLVPLLEGRGLSPGLAAWALGLGGAGQVAGRLGYRRLASPSGARSRAAAVIAAVAATTLLVGLLPGPAPLLVAGAVLAGAARGLFTLTQATLVSDCWGRSGTPSSTAFSTPLSSPPGLSPPLSAPVSPPLPAASPPCTPCWQPQARPGPCSRLPHPRR